jgi:hypothetical protein
VLRLDLRQSACHQATRCLSLPTRRAGAGVSLAPGALAEGLVDAPIAIPTKACPSTGITLTSAHGTSRAEGLQVIDAV